MNEIYLYLQEEMKGFTEEQIQEATEKLEVLLEILAEYSTQDID